MRRFDDPSPWCRSRAAQKRACPSCGRRLRFEFSRLSPNGGYDRCDACGYFQSVTAPDAAKVEYMPPTWEEEAEINRQSIADWVEDGRIEEEKRKTAEKCAAILRIKSMLNKS